MFGALERRETDQHRLEPHEDNNTDVILIGHSMGGILSGEVALKPPTSGAKDKPFQHRILGTISMDTPFLGMHPGVVAAGLGSLFRPEPKPPVMANEAAEGSTQTLASQVSASTTSYVTSADSETSSQISGARSVTSPLATPGPEDPFYNPPFPNDVRRPDRKAWANLLHFVSKHSDGSTIVSKLNNLATAGSAYVISHLEFGGCLTDYAALKNRYSRLRALEDVDEVAGRHSLPPKRRIRFVNYYTASTGRPKPVKKPKTPDTPSTPLEPETGDLTLSSNVDPSQQSTPRISIEVFREGPAPDQELGSNLDIPGQVKSMGASSGVQNDVQEEPLAEMRHIDSMPIEDDDEPLPPPSTTTRTISAQESTVDLETVTSPTDPALPPIPPMPATPEFIDLNLYTDKDARKVAEKEQKRLMKNFQQALKDRDSAVKDRQKFIEKREKKAKQELEKQNKALEKQRLREEKEEEKRKLTVNPEPRPRQDSAATASREAGRERTPSPKKLQKDKKFCMLPPEYGGKRDKCWIRVYMEGVDEVGAHCGLFIPGPQYESLVNDVGERVGRWVEEDARRRAVMGDGW